MSQKNIINIRDFNHKVRPTDDFFEYANGGWLRQNSIPKDQAKWGTFNILNNINQDRLKSIFNSLKRQKNLKSSSDHQKLRDYFISGTDLKKRDKSGLKELEPLLCRADEIKNSKSLFALVGELNKLGSAPFWIPHVGQDERFVEKYIFRFYQGGLGLPDKDYYLKNDIHSKKIRQEYLKYVAKVFSLAGFNRTEAETLGASVLKTETKLARVSMSKVDQRNPILNYNKFTYQELVKKYPNIAWLEYFEGIGIKNLKTLIVSQPKFFAGIDRMILAGNLSDLRIYIKFNILSGFGSYLGAGFRKADFDFYGRILAGLKKPKPIWKGVISEIDGSIGDAVGREYVNRYFSPHAKKHVLVMTKNIISAFRERIMALDWMTKETKKKALLKLDNFSVKIGYPDKWIDYSKLKITPDSYLRNHMEASKFHFKRTMDKLKKKKVDRKEWQMNPQTVNAYFMPPMNEIVFPAAILTAPFFDEQSPDAMNYGGIGTVIGHELTHGFDDEGSLYDFKGNLKNWWTKSDREKFDKKTKILEKQFSNFEPLKGLKINGKLTLGENIADLGGLIISYHGYLKSLKDKKVLNKKIGKFSNAELFFLNYAITERSKQTDQILKSQIISDSHSPSKWRVLGPLSNMDEFYEIFGTKMGDKMYLPEDKRARIW